MNGHGKLRRCAEPRAAIAAFYPFRVAAFVIARMMIGPARRPYRRPTRPTACLR
jgi:hypothetical protein